MLWYTWLFGSFRKELLESDLENVSFGKMLAGDLLAISNPERFIWNFETEDSLEVVLVQLAKGVQRVVVNKRKAGSHAPITSEVFAFSRKSGTIKSN
jgi:hypothetical protein